MTNPIPNYSILFNAAPYRVIKDSVKSITGETIPIEFYILPESYDKGAWLIEETKKYNAFFEKYLGPFPLRSQKLGIVETPHLGMEHSTADRIRKQVPIRPRRFRLADASRVRPRVVGESRHRRATGATSGSTRASSRSWTRSISSTSGKRTRISPR